MNLAAMRGFRFLDAAAVAKLPTDELLRRVEAVPVRNGELGMIEAAAVLGGAKEPSITVSRALEVVWTLAMDRTIGKSEDQWRRWRNLRIKAVRNFIAVIGDRPIGQITGDNMLDFQQWWVERLETEGKSAHSANKDITHSAAGAIYIYRIGRALRRGLTNEMGSAR